VDIGNLKEGTRVHGEMCVHPDSVLAILMENWEDCSRPNATQEFQKLNIGRTLPPQRGFHGSPKMATTETHSVIPPPIDQGTKQAVASQNEEIAEGVCDTSLDNERKDMENTDEPTEDDETATSEKSEESVTTLDSKPKAQADLTAIRQYLMMDFAQCIKLSESPATYVIYLYNKAYIFFSA
jgi:hypothetical protein